MFSSSSKLYTGEIVRFNAAARSCGESSVLCRELFLVYPWKRLLCWTSNKFLNLLLKPESSCRAARRLTVDVVAALCCASRLIWCQLHQFYILKWVYRWSGIKTECLSAELKWLTRRSTAQLTTSRGCTQCGQTPHCVVGVNGNSHRLY